MTAGNMLQSQRGKILTEPREESRSACHRGRNKWSGSWGKNRNFPGGKGGMVREKSILAETTLWEREWGGQGALRVGSGTNDSWNPEKLDLNSVLGNGLPESLKEMMQLLRIHDGGSMFGDNMPRHDPHISYRHVVFFPGCSMFSVWQVCPGIKLSV